VAGHKGMVGSALVRRLKAEPVEIVVAEHRGLDLTRQAETEVWVRDKRRHGVILAAGRVGGIAYNNAYPVDFLADNLAIELNVIRGAFAAGVRKLLFLGSSCIYDLADASVFVLKHYSGEFLNVGTGHDLTIAEFARLVADVVGYSGPITFDPS